MIVIEKQERSKRDVRTEIQRINEVVSFPPVVAEILQAMSDADVTMAKVTSIIESDPALTAKILRVANSPFYGLRRDVTNIGQALRLLGLDEIGHLLLTCQMKSRLMSLNEHQQTHLERLWKHSVAVAAAARLLAARYKIPTEGKEYTAGLLHDMGKLVLIQYFPEQFAAVEAIIDGEGIGDTEAEQRVIAISHAEIGKLIGEKWRLPKEYLEVMQYHHRPALSSNQSLLCAVVRCADLFCEQWGFGIGEQKSGFAFDDEVAGIMLDAVPQLGELPAETVNVELRAEFEQQLEHIQVLM
ncbi:MAG: HDOD domain-containing protein [Bacteroidota bacterium]